MVDQQTGPPITGFLAPTSTNPWPHSCLIGLELVDNVGDKPGVYQSTVAAVSDCMVFAIYKTHFNQAWSTRYSDVQYYCVDRALTSCVMYDFRPPATVPLEVACITSVEVGVLLPVRDDDCPRAGNQGPIALPHYGDVSTIMESGDVHGEADSVGGSGVSKWGSRIVAPIVAAIEGKIAHPSEYLHPTSTPMDIHSSVKAPPPVNDKSLGHVSWKNSFCLSRDSADSFTDGESNHNSDNGAHSFPLDCPSSDHYTCVVNMSLLALQSELTEAGNNCSIYCKQGQNNYNRCNSWGVGSNYHKDGVRRLDSKRDLVHPHMDVCANNNCNEDLALFEDYDNENDPKSSSMPWMARDETVAQ
jgi:hypothetical protein